jgi:hypothetical protein
VFGSLPVGPRSPGQHNIVSVTASLFGEDASLMQGKGEFGSHSTQTAIDRQKSHICIKALHVAPMHARYDPKAAAAGSRLHGTQCGWVFQQGVRLKLLIRLPITFERRVPTSLSDDIPLPFAICSSQVAVRALGLF